MAKSNRMPVLTGFSFPGGGAQWENRKSERGIAAGVIKRLEDRRVLYNPYEAETPSYCVDSVQKIREILLDAFVECDRDGVLAAQLRALSAACRRFVDRIDGRDPSLQSEMAMHGHWRSWVFQDALGQLRGVFGVQIAAMSEWFEIETTDELKSIFPALPEQDELNA